MHMFTMKEQQKQTHHYNVVVGAVVQWVEYRTRNQEVAGSTHTRSTASNLELVANLLCAQANSAWYLSGTRNE